MNQEKFHRPIQKPRVEPINFDIHVAGDGKWPNTTIYRPLAVHHQISSLVKYIK